MLPIPTAPPPDLIRVDIPDHPMAIISSEKGSLLSEAPDDTPWRNESMAVIDSSPNTGNVVAHDLKRIMNINPWHEAGHLGQGIKIAVFDASWYGADLLEEELGVYQTHDCFRHRSCNTPIDPFGANFEFERGGHGIACAEIVRDMAPEAELHLVRVNGVTTLENAVNWAIREEIDVISMSMSFFNESFYDGTGPVSELIEELHQADILMVTSAGNYARQHHRDFFNEKDETGLHLYEHGTTYLSIYLPEGLNYIYVLWDEFRSCGRTDFDAFLWNNEGLIVGKSLNRQSNENNYCQPLERLKAQVIEPGWHWLQIKRHRGVGDTELDIIARTGFIYSHEADYSIVDPAAHPLSFTVGAVRANEYIKNPAEPWSSQGSTNSPVQKPNVLGPNGLSTVTYGPWGFYGTSASTPAVAGALTLILSKNPGMSPYDAARLMEMSAIPDIKKIDFSSSSSGPGKARLPAVSSSSGCQYSMGLLPVLFGFFRRSRKDRVNCQQKNFEEIK